MARANILVVDDEPDIRRLVRDILEDENYEVTTADGAMQARAACMGRKPDVVLLDIWMPGTDGISLLKEWCAEGELPFRVIMMSGHGTIETAVEATRMGAFDFLEKPLSMAKLLVTVEKALQVLRLEQEHRGLKRFAIEPGSPIGDSMLMQQLREQAANVARHDSPVLLAGEAGSGKETLARHIHGLGPRRDGPFETLRAGAIASENIEKGIFGQEKGGQVYYGHLERAHGGTLFLDEVGDLDLSTQARLLSALREAEFLRVDGAQAVTVDIRVIASTRLDLEAAVHDGGFRDDLFYYLNVLPIRVPPLREHPEDIPDLVNHYMDIYARTEDMPVRSFTEDAMALLKNYDWPGNIRELKNLIQRMMILGHSSRIDASDVRNTFGRIAGMDETLTIDESILELPLREARESFERDYLLYQWNSVGGSVSRLAIKIGMERTHLYRKLKSLGIDHKKSVKQK